MEHSTFFPSWRFARARNDSVLVSSDCLAIISMPRTANFYEGVIYPGLLTRVTRAITCKLFAPHWSPEYTQDRGGFLNAPFRSQSFFTMVILYANNFYSKLSGALCKTRPLSWPWKSEGHSSESSTANAPRRVPFAWIPNANFDRDFLRA